MRLPIGGLTYTMGTIFYHNRRVPYSHAIWHLFVLAAAPATSLPSTSNCWLFDPALQSGAGRSLSPTSQVSMARAALRPSAIAQTMSD